MLNASRVSVNNAAALLVDRLVADAAELRLDVSHGARGELLVDAGQRARGGISAGLRIAEICMGGLGTCILSPDSGHPAWPFKLTTRASNPVIACLASQYAGWQLASEGADGFFALGSGPARALARKEDIFADIGYADKADRAILVLESERPPPPDVVDSVAAASGVAADRVAFIYAPTQSLVGSVQVTARVLEVALHKAHALHFPLADIVDGIGSAPLPPPHPDFVTAMGRTNDAIIYGGQVQLFVSGAPSHARHLAERLPSRMSKDYGRPFAEIFRAYDGDFYKVDSTLFSPALALVTSLETGETFRGGEINLALIDASFA
ncbi:MAG: methenyltetrahydromethanopterin cyclohydrolase [Beijerinckiaceae bacterium]